MTVRVTHRIRLYIVSVREATAKMKLSKGTRISRYSAEESMEATRMAQWRMAHLRDRVIVMEASMWCIIRLLRHGVYVKFLLS